MPKQDPADIEVTLSNILRYPDIRQLKQALHARLRQESVANLLLAAAPEFPGWYAGGPG